MGYDYLAECEKTAKILHFSSYKDYSKPWNPVSIMPGYAVWWKYAQDSPYYKEYFEEQWRLYDKVKQEKEAADKNVSYRNILLCAFILFVGFSTGTAILLNGFVGAVFAAEALFAVGLSILIRKIGIWYQRMRSGY